MALEQAPPSLNSRAAAAYFAGQPDVILAYLFGSLARGQADRFSDLDIAVLLDDKTGREQFLERQLRLTEGIESHADGELQVTLLNLASPMLAFQVIRDGVLLYQRSQTERIAFEMDSMKRYHDARPMLEFFNQARLKRIEENGIGRRKRDSARTLEAARRIHERLARIAKS